MNNHDKKALIAKADKLVKGTLETEGKTYYDSDGKPVAWSSNVTPRRAEKKPLIEELFNQIREHFRQANDVKGYRLHVEIYEYARDYYEDLISVIEADNARLQELLDSTLAQLHKTQEQRDGLKELLDNRQILLLKAEVSTGKQRSISNRWKAVALAILPSKNHNDIYLKEAILDGNINDAERLLGIGESGRKEP